MKIRPMYISAESHAAGRVVLTGAPLEVSSALVFEGVLDGILQVGHVADGMLHVGLGRGEGDVRLSSFMSAHQPTFLQAETAGTATTLVLGHIPIFVFGSALYGIAFALAFFGCVHAPGPAEGLRTTS